MNQQQQEVIVLRYIGGVVVVELARVAVDHVGDVVPVFEAEVLGLHRVYEVDDVLLLSPRILGKTNGDTVLLGDVVVVLSNEDLAYLVREQLRHADHKLS